MLDPALKSTLKSANYPVNPDEAFTKTIKNVISVIDANKSVNWFAGDLGMHLPLIFHTISSNIHLVGSGVYETNDDHYLDVVIKPDTLEIKSMNFLTSAAFELFEFTNPKFTDRQLLPRKAYNECWTETILTKLFSSGMDGKKTPVKAVQLEEDTLKAFDLYYLADSNNILLNKDNCDLSGDDLFSVQFHSSHVEDRRHRQRPWNG